MDTSSVLDAIEANRQAIQAPCRELGARLFYLFGSHARGQALPVSDVDFAVEFESHVPNEEHAGRQERMIVELMRILRRNDVDVAVLNRGSALLRHRVATEGELVFAKSPQAHAEFLVRSLREYDDTRSLREATAASLKRAE